MLHRLHWVCLGLLRCLIALATLSLFELVAGVTSVALGLFGFIALPYCVGSVVLG